VKTRQLSVGLPGLQGALELLLTYKASPRYQKNNAAPRGRHFCLAMSKFWPCVGSGFSQVSGNSNCRERTYSCLYTVPFFITKRTSSITL